MILERICTLETFNKLHKAYFSHLENQSKVFFKGVFQELCHTIYVKYIVRHLAQSRYFS